jgi:hypothetical protein
MGGEAGTGWWSAERDSVRTGADDSNRATRTTVSFGDRCKARATAPALEPIKLEIFSSFQFSTLTRLKRKTSRSCDY